MRILHFSDVHIGVENYGRPDPNTGLSSRLVDFMKTLDEVVEYALNNDVDLLLFCGDAYKSRDPTQTHQREFAKRIAKISGAGIPVFLVAGNHDVPLVTSRASALDIFDTLQVNNVQTAERLNTYVVTTSDGPIQIIALPWIRRSGFLASESTRRLTPEEVNKTIQENLTGMIRAHAEALDKNIPAIFAGHVSVSEATTSSEQSMLLGKEHVLLNSSVALPQFDYVALGHIHKHQILNRDPYLVYSGSLQRIDFGEENDEKGFCVIDIDPKMPRGLRIRNFEFQTVDAREFLTIKIDVNPGDTDPTDSAINSIRSYHLQDAIVRVIIRLQERDDRLNDREIRRSLENAHFISSITKEVLSSELPRLGNVDTQTLEPLAALDLYLQGRGVDPKRAQVLMDHAQILVNENADDV